MPTSCAIRDPGPTPGEPGPAGGGQPPRPERPDQVWRRLAPLLAAPGRSAIRLHDPATGKFSGSGRMSARLPARPAAVPLFTRSGRAHMLALDFDAARAAPGRADADLAAAAEWITRCGGVVVTDRSPGGRHLWAPLAIGATAGAAEVAHLARLLAARLPTLDITPLLNPATGCLSAPGTLTKDGAGHRQLDGSLDAAVDACTTRSHPALLPRLGELLGALTPRTGPTPARAPAGGKVGATAFCVDCGTDEMRLADAWVRADPIPPVIAGFAERGDLAGRPWASRSEARMSVIVAAVARGHSLASLRDLAGPGGPWERGLGAAYRRYGGHGDSAMARDVARALGWWCENPLKHRRPQHKPKNSQGGTGPKGPESLRRWLAGALAWADSEYAGRRRRWTVHAALQTLAWHAQQAGRRVAGVWVVGVGGRSLALGSGLLSEDTMWRVLRDLRERPGAPVLLTRPAVGMEADAYALTSAAGGREVDPAWVGRVRVEPVHDAWSVLGHHHRRLYELVACHGLADRADLLAAARVSPSAGDATLAELLRAGLVVRTGRGSVAAGPTSLDDIAAAHDTDTRRAERVSLYRAERASWRAWLQQRQDQRDGHPAPATATAAVSAMPPPIDDAEYRQRFWADVMIHGPPRHGDCDDEALALDLLAEILGARILPLQQPRPGPAHKVWGRGRAVPPGEARLGGFASGRESDT